MLGAGPAGLSAGYLLASRQQPAIVYEASDSVGGIAKTVALDGHRFDLGGQRLCTKLAPIERIWHGVLGDELILAPRSSGIYYHGGYLGYPLRPSDVLIKLGPLESGLCALSYLAETCKPARESSPANLEQWVTLRFGARFYDGFFRPYAEKVWGLAGSDITPDWGSERIASITLMNTVLATMRRRGQHPKNAEDAYYPRLGPGQLWTAIEARIARAGVHVRTRHRCLQLAHDGTRISHVTIDSDGVRLESRVQGVVSTVPLTALVRMLNPAPPAAVRRAAATLRYRSMCVVALVTKQTNPFPDHWIYLPDGTTKASRVQNYGAWSGDMVQPGTTCLGVEYFCAPTDEIWAMDDAQAARFAAIELGRIGLIDPKQVVGGMKVRVPAAYPLYDSGHLGAVATIRGYLERFENLETCGRNGLHRHNNQDHSMWTAILAASNLLDGREHDVWNARTDEVTPAQWEAVEPILAAACSAS